MKKLVLALCTLSVITTAMAELKSEDKITFRQSGYTFMRWHMGKIKAQVVDNAESYDKAQIIASADVIAATANSGIETLFGPDTQTGKGWKDTRVKPEFFKEPGKVKDYFDAFKKEANSMTQVARTGDADAIKGQFNKLQKSCKNCHEDFRTKDQ